MSTYRRFVAYVYRFQNGKKGSNCGFVKVEAHNGICTLYFRIQGLRMEGTCRLWAFAEHGQEYDLLPLAQAEVKNGLIHKRVDTDRLHMGGSGYTLEQCSGLLCTGQGDEYYGTAWGKAGKVPNWEEMPEAANDADAETEVTRDADLSPENTAPVEEPVMEPLQEDADGCQQPSEEDNIPDAEPEPEEAESVISPETEAIAEPEPQPVEREPIAESQPEEPATEQKQEETPESGDMRQAEAAPKTFEEVWAYMQQEFPAMDPFEDGGVVEGIKIAPSDIPYLQEQRWNLGSNKFLLHGYKNYRHLMLGRLEGQNRYILGVPGVYDQQEQFMAKMFGFPCFKPIRQCKNRNGQFGYWFRCIC